MSSYGPPGGGQHPDEPTDPWQGAAGDPYGGQPGQSPYDPPDDGADDAWNRRRQQDPAFEETVYTPEHGTYSADWDQLSEDLPQKPSQRTPGTASKVLSVLTIAAVLVLLSAAVVGFAFVFLGDDGTPSANPESSASPATTAPASDATGTPPPSAKTAIDDAAVGDCLFDTDPSDTSASLEYASCDQRGEDYYEVLMRYDGTTDDSRCEDVAGYDSSFVSSTENYVLCVDELTEEKTAGPN